MSSDSIQKHIDEYKSKLSSKLSALTDEADRLRKEAQSLDQLAIEEKERVDEFTKWLKPVSDHIADTKTLHEMKDKMVAKEDVEEVLSDLETSTAPDYKSARSKLGIDETKEEGEEALITSVA